MGGFWLPETRPAIGSDFSAQLSLGPGAESDWASTDPLGTCTEEKRRKLLGKVMPATDSFILENGAPNHPPAWSVLALARWFVQCTSRRRE
jgi:hypothetical protein